MIKRFQPGMWTVADRYAFGPYCGERLFSLRSWRSSQLFRRTTNGFSIGPILFWKKVNGQW